MTPKFHLFKKSDVFKIIKKRQGETKFGEHVKTLTSVSNIYEGINNLDVNYVLLGLKEDLGVYSNHGKTGTYKAWDTSIKILLNTQSNIYTHAKKVLVLGHIEFSHLNELYTEYDRNNKRDLNKLRRLVERFDKLVTHYVHLIVKAGKIPIIIGGGHNNAYGNIKGSALALRKPINVVNLDAHTDFRALEGRHSGNGFSYAYFEGFLKNYFVFGLHENYTSNEILNSFKTNKHLNFISYEALNIRNEIHFKDAIKRIKNKICKKHFGLEIDCDTIINIPSSAKTPSGLSVEQTRQFTHLIAQEKKLNYFHICEAIPNKKDSKQIGKLISFLITDFIRSRETTFSEVNN